MTVCGRNILVTVGSASGHGKINFISEKPDMGITINDKSEPLGNGRIGRLF